LRHKRVVTIDAFPESAFRHLERDAIICIDVIRTTTTLVSSVSQGRLSFTAPNVERALELASCLDSPLLAGEVDGCKPEGFTLEDSPSAILARKDVWRPLVLLSTPGTKLIANTAACPAVYIASFQNLSATAEHVAAQHDRVALLGAGAQGEFSCEDQMAAAWLAQKLVEWEFEPEDMPTAELIDRWSDADISLTSWGNSAASLRSAAQLEDLDFVLGHVDDLDLVCCYRDEEVVPWSDRSIALDILHSWPTKSVHMESS